MSAWKCYRPDEATAGTWYIGTWSTLLFSSAFYHCFHEMLSASIPLLSMLSWRLISQIKPIFWSGFSQRDTKKLWLLFYPSHHFGLNIGLSLSVRYWAGNLKHVLQSKYYLLPYLLIFNFPSDSCKVLGAMMNYGFL